MYVYIPTIVGILIPWSPSVATPRRCTSPAPGCCQRRSFRNPWPPTSPAAQEGQQIHYILGLAKVSLLS